MVFWWFMISVGLWGASLAAHHVWAVRAAPQDPLAQQQWVLQRELAALDRLDPVLWEPRQTASWIGTTLRDSVLVTSLGFARALMNWPATFRQVEAAQRTPGAVPPAVAVDAGAAHVAHELTTTGSSWASLLTSTYILAVRTAMFTTAAPLLLLVFGLAVVDGLVARSIRKATAGRESASLYHRAKLGLSFVAILGYIVGLLMPSLQQPAALLVPMVLAMGGLLRMQCATYKKYL